MIYHISVILKKLPEKLGDPRKFLIPCGFSELKCKALADLGASINLMPLSVWKELGFPELISTRMTLELANRAICTPAGIARDVFVPVGKFTFLGDFVIVDYESDPRVPLILGRPFLRIARALIDVYGEEMILRNGDERLTLNMKHDTSSYSNHPQRESVNLINVFNVLSEDFLEVSLSNKPSGNPTFSLHQELTLSEVTYDIHDSEGCNVLFEKFPDIDSTQDLHPYFDDNPLSGSTTYSANSLLEEFTDGLALITYPPEYNDNLQFDIESNLKEIEFLLYQGKDSSLKDSIDQTDLANLEDNFVDPIPEMFTDEHAPDYSSPPIFDVYYDDFLEVESDADNVYDDPFDSKGEKIKESKLLIDELDIPCDFLPYFEYGSILSYENEVLQNVFMNKECDLENTHVNDRYSEEMHAVPPMTGNYMPSGPDVEIDYSKFINGPKQTLVDESDAKTYENASSESDSSEYKSDSDDDSVSNVQENIEKPSFAFTDFVKHVKSPRENVKEIGTPNHYPKIKKQDRHSHTRKENGKTSCTNQSKEKVTGQKEHRPIWNNVQRMNHQNKFVPTKLLTKIGKLPVNVARQNLSRQAALTSTASKVNTVNSSLSAVKGNRDTDVKA
nr:reverse transcriptase domain-containing protein [Tanacetum cinerariifolium]